MASKIKQFSILYIFAISMYVLSGCATPTARTDSSPESLRPGFDVVYYPAIQPGMTSDSAKKDWSALFPTSAFFDNRIEMQISQQKLTLFYYQLLYRKIVVEARKKENGGYERGVDIQFPDWGLHFDNLTKAQKAADTLFFMQQALKKFEEEQNNKLARFEPIAAQYRALASKPSVSEEQRRLIVQANALSQQKKYDKAVEQYLKALELNPTSYPAAYFNLALLNEQLIRPLSAIIYMKHYLLLEPQAKDARSAQDKIYEWELMLGK